MSLWKTISYWGFNKTNTLHHARNVVLTNRVSILIAGLAFILFLVSALSFGFIYSSQLALGFSLVFLLPLFINHLGFTSASRILLSIVLSLASVVTSVVDKFDYFQLEEFQYFEFRLTLLAATLFPFILFKMEERKYWIPALIINFVCLLLFDPIHALFGVGYYQMGFTAPNYYFLNYVVLTTFLVISISAYFLKNSFEKSDTENQSLILSLNATNENLKKQRELLLEQQQKLVEANELIGRQREMLAAENSQLSEEIIEKNKQLTETNSELINHNNDLQQFSYTISHNLRGPMASIGGLLNLLDFNELGPNNRPLFEHFRTSMNSLESTIKDLSNIIDIRNKITKLRQRILWVTELEHIRTLLKKDIDDYGVTIHSNFESAPEVYSVKIMVHSILYNLISNAIKYRHSERACVISVSTSREGSFIQLDVADNGIGLDMNRFGSQVFSLYRRFHTHVEGKGLGLFLVKLQTEAMGGSIRVKSSVNQGTTFSVYLKIPENIGEQLIFQNDVVSIFFDASIEALCVIWQRDHTPEEFEQVLSVSLDFLRAYRTPNWISDIRKVPQRDEAELNRIREKYKNEYLKIGVKTIVLIVSKKDYELPEYKKKLQQIKDAYPVKYGFCETLEEARQWIKDETR